MASTVLSEVLVLGAMRTKNKHLLRVPQTQLPEPASTFGAPHPISCSLCNKKQSGWLAFWAVRSPDLRKEKWTKEFVVSSMWAFQFFYVQEQYFQTLIFTNHFPNHFHICTACYMIFFIKSTHFKK